MREFCSSQTQDLDSTKHLLDFFQQFLLYRNKFLEMAHPGLKINIGPSLIAMCCYFHLRGLRVGLRWSIS